METWLDRARQSSQQAGEKWKELSLNRKLLFSAIAVGLIIAIVFLILSSNTTTPYEVLYAELDQKDASAVTAKLDELKVPYELENNGTTIMVAPDVKDSTRLKLAAENLPSGEAGFELFSATNFGETQTDKKVKYQRALQGELARTIQSLDKIKAAKVNLALPEESLFSETQEDPKASVVINTKEDEKLTPKEVKAIVNLVANSVERLSPDNVVIVDQDGNLVSENMPEEEEQKSVSEIVRTQLAMKKQFEKDKQEAVQTMLDKALGKNNSVVRVNAELNFNDREQFDEKYTHDPDGPFVVSENIKKESGTETTNNIANVPGTDTNIPQYTQPTTEGGTSTYDKSEKTRNYDLNKTETVTDFQIGDVKYDYLTVSVFINNAAVKNATMGTTQQQKEDKVRSMVATACGLRENRQDENVRLADSISVAFIDFYTEPVPEAVPQGAFQRFMGTPAAPWLLVFLALVIIVLVWLLKQRRDRQEREAEELLALQQAQEHAFEETAEEEISLEEIIERDMTPEEREKQRVRQEIDKLIEDNPENAAQVLKTWLIEDLR
ncbi:MAG: flagellar M-ring protein FliF [Syntrophomonadaceae bacterium]|nr:flagellar M-ring protein FliF [Syntrophomonadaceae bacterium]